MPVKDYFLSKLAQGDQFCNRSKEKALLHQNIDQCRHTVFIRLNLKMTPYRNVS